MSNLVIFFAIMLPYVFVMWSNFWCKREYEATEEETITKTWGGDNDDKYVVKFVPLYENFWGKLYYGEYTQDPWLAKEWHRVEYYGGNIFGGDPSLFTKRRIYHDARFQEDWIGRQIKKEQEHSDAAASWLNETEGQEDD